MLDDIPEKPGQIVIIPGPTPPPAPAQAPTTTSSTTPPAPAGAPQPAAAAAQAGRGTLADAMRGALGLGIYITPPAPGTPAAAALDEIAKQCQRPVADVQNAMRGLSRQASAARQQLNSLDGKESGNLLAVTVAAPAPLPAGLACLGGAPASAIRIDLVEKAREFGPTDVVQGPSAGQAQLTAELNKSFGDPARPWRLPTMDELLAIMPVLFNETLWGPDGGRFWTSHQLADGSQIVLVARTEKQDYQVSIETAAAGAKARPIWVRARTN